MLNAIKKFVYFSLLPFLNARLLRFFSLKLVTLRTPNRTFTEFFRHLAALEFKAATVIDIGVGNGTHSLYQGNKGARFYLIEPIPDWKGKVAAIAARLGAEFFNVAASAEKGEIDFFVHHDITGSSMFRQLENLEKLDGERVKVPALPLDQMIPEDVARPCVLKIDTQGAELEVLKGARNTLQNVDIAIIEVSLHQFRENCPEMDEVTAAMNKLGFVTYETLEGHYRSIDGALAQIDVVFVPRDSILRRDKIFFSQEQAQNYVRHGRIT